jgi:hypothetical protein
MATASGEVGNGPRGTALGAVAAGLAGTAVVTALNEGVRRVLPGAPHAEWLGERGVRAIARRAGVAPPRGRALYWTALAGEVLSNTAYYATPGLARRRPFLAAAALGVAAGLGAVFLPERLGLGRSPTRRSRRTATLSFAWYLAGGLAAGLAHRLARRSALAT